VEKTTMIVMGSMNPPPLSGYGIRRGRIGKPNKFKPSTPAKRDA
jgi:hypothetical protein